VNAMGADLCIAVNVVPPLKLGVENAVSKAVRMVKIDPRLTTAAMKERLPQAVVIAILQACKVLGVHCIAKNVETQAALDWLQATGCDFAQGYALEKPLSLESLASPSPTLPRAPGKDGKARK